MFQAPLSHLQEALHKPQLVYCVSIMSVGCCQGWSGTAAHATIGILRSCCVGCCQGWSGTSAHATIGILRACCLLSAAGVGVEPLHKQHLVHCVRVMSAGCCQGSTPTMAAASRHNTHTKYQLLFVWRLLKMSK
jgi:hypothetical protein